MKNLIGKNVRVISDNECYELFSKKVLTITHAYNKGRYYDESMYPQMLCEFTDEKGESIPFALYEYEFCVI